ncbi:TPA: toxin VasX [Morganella morganii]
MTEHVSSDVLTPEEKHLRKMVEAVNQAAPRNLPADAVICPCENEHRPVYPVRYAYSNLSGDKNAAAAMPPEVSTLMTASSMAETKGFSVRLLRPGWVYVFEEGQFPTRTDSRGQLLIFKHIVRYYDDGYVYTDDDITPEAQQAREAGDAEEGFIPYLRCASDNTLQEQSCQYPYLPVKKDVINASFIFSDIPLSDYVLNKIETDESYRRAFMQKINVVDFSHNPHALELSEAHVEHLVEEYKAEEQQFSVFTEHTRAIGNPLPKEYFSHIAALSSATATTDRLLNQIEQFLDHEEKSCLVALYDPVGYQKDILSLYSFVTTSYAMFQHHWEYPNKIGQYLSVLEAQFSSDEMAKTGAGQKLAEKFNKHIDVPGWKTYWPQIDKGYQEFEALQNNVIQIYYDFLTNPAVSSRQGGIKHYLDHAFLIQEQYESGDFPHSGFLDELNAWSQLHELLLTPLNSTAYGRAKLDILFSADTEESSIWVSFMTSFLSVLNEDEIKSEALTVFKKRVLPVLQSAVMICWDVLGYAYAEIHPMLGEARNQVRRISKAGIDFLARKVLPAFLAYYGVTLSIDKLNTLGADAFRVWMNSLNAKSESLKPVANKMKKMFDWDKRLQASGSAPVITTAKFGLITDFHKTVLPEGKKSLMEHIQFGEKVFALISGIIELSVVARTKEFELNSPLHVAAANLFRVQMVANLLSTADAIINIRKAAPGYSATITYPPLQRLLTKITLPEIKTELGKAGMKLFGYTVTFMGFALPVAEAAAEFMDGNKITGSAKITEAVGSLVFSLGMAGLGLTQITSVTTLFLFAFAWELVVIGAVLIGIGSAVYHWFKTDDFENLLKKCFWGNGDKYFAGGYKIKNNPKIDRAPLKEQQLEKYIKFFNDYENYYQIEIQEFKNLFFTSQLKVEAVPNANVPRNEIHYGVVHYMIQYHFKLSNFQYGLSDIEYQLAEKESQPVNPSDRPAKPGDKVVTRRGIQYLASQNKKFNAAFESALQNALETTLRNRETTKKAKSGNGGLELKFEVYTSVFMGSPVREKIPSVYWYYLVDRLNGDIAPLRYRDNNPEEKIYGCIDEEGTA